MTKKKKTEWSGGRVAEPVQIAGMNLTPMTPPESKPKEKTIKELQAECNKRNVGFMTTWSKKALIQRLKEEDEKDAEIAELRAASEDAYERAKIAESKPLKDAQEKLVHEKRLLRKYEVRIKELMDEKFSIMQKEQKVRHEVEQLEVLIKSLI